MGDFGDPIKLYFEGDMEAAIPLSGQVAGRMNHRASGSNPAKRQKRIFHNLRSLSRKYL